MGFIRTTWTAPPGIRWRSGEVRIRRTSPLRQPLPDQTGAGPGRRHSARPGMTGRPDGSTDTPPERYCRPRWLLSRPSPGVAPTPSPVRSASGKHPRQRTVACDRPRRRSILRTRARASSTLIRPCSTGPRLTHRAAGAVVDPIRLSSCQIIQDREDHRKRSIDCPSMRGVRLEGQALLCDPSQSLPLPTPPREIDINRSVGPPPVARQAGRSLFRRRIAAILPSIGFSRGMVRSPLAAAAGPARHGRDSHSQYPVAAYARFAYSRFPNPIRCDSLPSQRRV